MFDLPLPKFVSPLQLYEQQQNFMKQNALAALKNQQQQIMNQYLPQQEQAKNALLNAETLLEQTKARQPYSQSALYDILKSPQGYFRVNKLTGETIPIKSNGNNLMPTTGGMTIAQQPGGGLIVTTGNQDIAPWANTQPTSINTKNAIPVTSPPRNSVEIGTQDPQGNLRVNPFSISRYSYKGAQYVVKDPNTGMMTYYQSPTQAESTNIQKRLTAESEAKALTNPVISGISPYWFTGGGAKIQTDLLKAKTGNKVAQQNLINYLASRMLIRESVLNSLRQSGAQNIGEEMINRQVKQLYPNLPYDIWTLDIPSDMMTKAAERRQQILSSGVQQTALTAQKNFPVSQNTSFVSPFKNYSSSDIKEYANEQGRSISDVIKFLRSQGAT